MQLQHDARRTIANLRTCVWYVITHSFTQRRMPKKRDILHSVDMSKGNGSLVVNDGLTRPVKRACVCVASI